MTKEAKQKQSPSQFPSAMTILIILLSLICFQNCSPVSLATIAGAGVTPASETSPIVANSPTSPTSQTSAANSSGNGGGYNGMLFDQIGVCDGLNNAVQARIVVSTNSFLYPVSAELVRSNCNDLSTPVPIDIQSQISFASDMTSLTYQSNLFSIESSSDASVKSSGIQVTCLLPSNSGSAAVAISISGIQGSLPNRTASGQIEYDEANGSHHSASLSLSENGSSWNYGNDVSDPSHYLHLDTSSTQGQRSFNFLLLFDQGSISETANGKISCFEP